MAFMPNELDPGRSARDLFGWEMRDHRKRADAMSLDQLTQIIGCISKGHLARIERAESMPPPELPAKLDAAFGTDGFFGRIYQLAKKEKFPGKYRRSVELEANASVIEEYAAATIPGLLQTPEVVRRSLQAGRPDMTPQELDASVAARLERQRRLDSDTPPHCWFVLDESVLRRPVGGAAAMRRQLAALASDRRPHVTMQVLPHSAGEHAEMGGSLFIYAVPGSPPVVWEEGARSGELIDDFESVAVRQRSYDLLRAMALSPRDSRAMIRRISQEYGRASRQAGEVAEE
ncbi:helix-turn-helix transcriptional regulator [Kitasatospora aureofaciens]|uniref:helix-turn-helix domain-containing protein n=1 Tax=Kitasatospora aureofaciens TaxID=1894 RepID=UPI001C43A8AC|nr:helix-turn-helix transcriptional regulator [Kitasatospora aureofaciens]MBV6702933.1 helix-turn-helix transcriptional regulator [Kitasatospora aureofaciens]